MSNPYKAMYLELRGAGIDLHNLLFDTFVLIGDIADSDEKQQISENIREAIHSIETAQINTERLLSEHPDPV